MKQFLIFSIFVCFATAKTLSNKDAIKFEGKEKIAMAECAREYNVDEKKYDHTIDLDEYEKHPDEETACMMACGTRKLMTQEMRGLDGKATLYNGFTKLIDEAYKAGLENEATNFTREDLVKKVEQCYASAHDECKFFECVEFYKTPFFDVFLFASLHSVDSTVFGDD